ncbi:MAG: helix-turn-helix domain-containing protein [Erysipelotrichaceae bacterium]|nr:helix-turn-helix domain-containing protein [Erysipelotrichaceae bacterium]
MSFAENLRQLRKEQQLSQEELAEILDVSRQAISKWEQGIGYPEVEKLLLLSSKLNVSLDYLMATEISQQSTDHKGNGTGQITITSPIERVIATCHKVMSSQKMSGGKSSPQYALFGKSEGKGFYGEEPTTFLGWYANEKDISKEIMEIHDAIVKGIATYTLKYSVRTKKRLLGIKIESE